MSDALNALMKSKFEMKTFTHDPSPESSVKEVYTETITPPKTDGSGNARENLLQAKEILQEEGWIIKNDKLTKDGEEFKFEFLIVSPSDEKIELANQSKLKKLGDINFWVDSKAYNHIENVHQILLLSLVDLIIGKTEYPPN